MRTPNLDLDPWQTVRLAEYGLESGHTARLCNFFDEAHRASGGSHPQGCNSLRGTLLVLFFEKGLKSF